MKKLFRKSIFFECIVIFLLSLTPLLWFKKGTLIFGHDNVFALNPIEFLNGRLFAWIDHGFGQSQDLIMGTISIHLIDAIPYILGLPIQATEMVVYVFWFFLIGISAYILARQFREQSWAFRLLAVVLYQFNFFLLQGWWIGERTKFSAYIAFPLIMTIFLRVYRRELGVLKASVCTTLIFFVFNAGGLYGTPLYGGVFIAILVFLLFFGFLDVIERNFKSIIRLLLLTLLSVIGYVLVNSYFIFPAVTRVASEYRQGVERVGGAEGLLDWAKEISAHTSYINLFRLEGIAEWYDNPEHPFARTFLKNPIFITLSFVWPVLIVLSLTTNYGREKQKIIVFFFLVFLVGMFLSSGTHRPFGIVYEALMRNVPGIAAFRSPYFKFAPSLFFAASFLIAFYIDSYHGKKKYIFFTFMIIFILVYHFPYFTGNFFSWKKGFSTRLEVPPYLIQFGDWLENEKKDDGRVLFLPPNSPSLRYSEYDWGYLSFQALPTLISNKSTIINNDRLNDDERKLVEALYEAFSDSDEQTIHKASSYLGIKYFLVQEDTVPEDVRSIFPLSAKTYEDVIEEKLQLSPIKKFGRWILYMLDTKVPPQFYTANDVTVISGAVHNFSYYYDFLGEKRALLKKDELKKILPAQVARPDIYSPTCLKCKKKDRPFIAFPERNVLPDSPFYPLVLLNEERSLRSQDPKDLVYDYLGLSLKRLAEINEMIEKDIHVSDEVFNRYEATINLIETNFNRLSKLEDKYSTAEDLTYYIKAQRELINETLGKEVSGLPAAILDRSLSSILSLEESIQRFVFTPDITQNRLYNLSLVEPGIYSLYIRSKEFKNVLRKDASITIQIDGFQTSAITTSDEGFKEAWFSFGDFVLNDGNHSVQLSFSELENKALFPEQSVTVFNADQRQRCFVSRVQDYDNTKRYKAVVRYRNDIFNDINVYVWEEKEKESRLRFASRLFKSLAEEEFTHEVDPERDIKGITLGFCSANLTEEFLRERFTIKVSELIEPVIIFLPKARQNIVLGDVVYKKINSTKYSVFFPVTNPNSIFVFNSRFDRGWELQGFNQNHISVNGFANGWIIDKKGEYSLTLTYKPQESVQLGGFFSIATVIGGVVYLVWDKIVQNKK